MPDEDLRQWASVALQDSSAEVEVRASTVGASPLLTCGGGVTVASLRPLMFVARDVDGLSHRYVRICFRERATDRLIAAIDCELAAKLRTASGSDLLQYRPTSNRLRIPSGRLLMAAGYRKLSSWRHRKRQDTHNFEMHGTDLRALQIFYVRPRPVVLTSVAAEGRENIFPMDLIGPVSGSEFTLALRSTSPAIELMRHSRRVVLVDVPADMKSVTYRLGAHHKQATINWSALPFATAKSPYFGLRYPTFGSQIREMSIDDVFEVGSHNLFLCSKVHSERRAESPQLHHTAGFYQAFRRRRGMAFPDAAP